MALTDFLPVQGHPYALIHQYQEHQLQLCLTTGVPQLRPSAQVISGRRVKKMMNVTNQTHPFLQ
jgi:hypothetical protein